MTTSLAETFLQGFAAGRTLPTEGFDEIHLAKVPGSLFSRVNCRTSALVWYLPDELVIDEFLKHLEYFENAIRTNQLSLTA